MKKLALSGLLILPLLVGGLLYLGRSQTALAATCTQTVSNTNDAGTGSFRQAILNANISSNVDTICFSITGGGVHTISPASQLPSIGQPAVVDASTQPGYSGSPLIELNGSNAAGPGLWVSAGGTTVRGFAINRFPANGIYIDSHSGDTIVANYIGTDPTGSTALPNGTDGIGIANMSGETIGGTTSSDRNVISGNKGNGIGITGSNASGNTIIGNYVGTNADGTAAVGNGADGVLINLGSNNVVGGSTGTTPYGACTGACNLVSGNGYNGIGVWMGTASGNSVKGNYVGTTASGESRLGNANIGVELNESPNNTVGGVTPTERNVLSANGGAGVFITGGGATGNTVEGNYIGTDATGGAAMGNVKMGVGIGYSPGILPAHDNLIGGTTGTAPGGNCTGACNVISANGQNGILITNGGGNQMRANYIGTNSAATEPLGNGFDGIGISASPNNGIGTGDAAGRNIISSNQDNGVIIAGDASTGNRLDGNYIGEGAASQNMGNGANGVQLAGGISTAIMSNNIYSNGKIGIDLGFNNVTLNHPVGASGGVNNQQNFPVIQSSISSGNTTKVYGNLKSQANTSYRLDFFDSNNCYAGYPNDYGQGQYYIGSQDVSTDAFGNVDFIFSPSNSVPGQHFITATASRKVNGVAAETSEFSECNQVNASRSAIVVGSTWLLRDALLPGNADINFPFGFTAVTLMCAWDPAKPHVKLPVIVNGSSWFMQNGFYPGNAALTFNFGIGVAGAIPVCGDWNGDGIDTPGFVSPNRTWYLRNSNSGGGADITPFQYGSYDSTPVVGDWNGDGIDTIGTVSPTMVWSLRDGNSSGPAQASFQYGSGGTAPVVGDWNGDGIDTIGTFSGGQWNLRNFNGSGSANISYGYGFGGATPLIWK